MNFQQVQVFDSLEALSHAAAGQFATLAGEAVSRRGRFLTALSGGGTPRQMYALLGRPPFLEQIPWGACHFFWGDERCVPPDHPESNFGQARAAFLERVGVPPENLHRVHGEWNPEKAAQEYADQLKQFAEPGLDWPRFDLVFLGLGEDGHTASLFPGIHAPNESKQPTLAVTAAYQSRPANRVTLTPLVFNAARQVTFLVVGAAKARALAAVLQGPRDPKHWPAQRIRPTAGRVTWLVDLPAAQTLDGR